MIKFILATPANANAVHICPLCNQTTPYTSQAVAFKDIHEFLPPSCVFGNGKDKHLVITCHHFDELGQAIKHAQNIASNESVSVAIKTITEQF